MIQLDIPILNNVEFDIVPQNSCNNIFCGYTRVKTMTPLSQSQKEYILANKQMVQDLVYKTNREQLLADFHQRLREAGCDWI